MLSVQLLALLKSSELFNEIIWLEIELMLYFKYLSLVLFTKLSNNFRFTRFIEIQETILRQVRILQFHSFTPRQHVWGQV